ncbi:MAG TPA: DUF2933 domain-containing protein [Pontiella sp.]
MHKDHEHYYKPESENRWWKSPSGIAALFFLAAIGYFLITEHWAHIVPYLPYLIILLCPLMHMFHHGKHSDHSHSDDHQEK